MNKSYQTLHINQAPKYSSVAVIVRKSTKSDQLVLKYLLNYANSPIFPSHETISKAVGYSIRTVINALNRLKANGLLSWKQRWNDSCWYTLSEEVLQPKNLSWLRSFYIGFMSIMLLAPYYSYPKGYLQTKRLKDLILLKNHPNQPDQHPTTSQVLSAMVVVGGMVNQKAASGMWQYPVDTGPANPKRSQEEFDALINNEDRTMKHVLPFSEEQLAELAKSGYGPETLHRAGQDLYKDIQAGKPISNQFKYFLAICNRLHTKPNQQRHQAGFANKEQAPRRHIDQALLQPLSEEAKKRRADERRQDWEDKRGKKENDLFYLPSRESKPVDQPDQWYTPEWCQARLVEDLKILHLASKADQANPYVRYSIPLIKARVAKCEAILSGSKPTTQPSKTTMTEKVQPSISAKDVILKYATEQQDLFDSLSSNELDYSELEEIL